MTIAKSAAQIIKAIGCKHLNLYRGVGSGYWYFVYSNENGNVYEDRSVYTPRLNDMSVDEWVAEGLECVKAAECK